MIAEISATKDEKEKILTLTATDHYDQQVLKEITKSGACMSAKYDPYIHTILEVSIPLK